MLVRALVVDDQADIRLLIRMIIESYDRGLSVGCEAGDGLGALEQLDGCDPDVVVLDHMMPGLTGLETAQRIRERRPGQAMVLCSAYLDDRLRASAGDVGIDVVLSKSQVDRIPQAIFAALALGGA